MTLRITETYAFIASNEEGEGICGFHSPGMGWMPMVGSDTDRVDLLRPIAAEMATQLGRPIEVARFALRDTIEQIQP